MKWYRCKHDGQFRSIDNDNIKPNCSICLKPMKEYKQNDKLRRKLPYKDLLD